MRAQESIARPDPDPLVRDELRMALHDEIDRLPDRYRRPVIACLLEGMSQEQAAARLGWTEGSVRGRLARGKARLRDRLTRRGIALAAVLAELAEPGPAAAAARPFLAILRTKAAGVVLSALLAMGGVTLAIALRADDPPQPPARAASAPPAPPPKDEPEPEILASFRGGGPTNESRATALPPEIAARPVEFLGRVLDPSGKGVAGARLSLITDAWSVPEPQTVSGIDGSFRFKKTVGDFWRNFAAGGMATPRVQAVVLATHDAFGVAWVNLRVVAKDGKPALGGEYPLSLRMVADRPIEGRLLDDQGRPDRGGRGAGRAGSTPYRPATSRRSSTRFGGSTSSLTRELTRGSGRTTRSAMVIPSATTGADGRFTLTGVGRDRQANLAATGPGMALMRWTVLNRDDATEVTKAVRARWPHTPSPDGPTAGKAAPDRNPGVQVYGPTFDLRVDSAGTISGVVRDATTGRPVQGAMVYIPHGGSGGATSDDQGHYRIIRQDGVNASPVDARPPNGAPLLGAAREYDGMTGIRRAHRRLRAPPRSRRLRPGRRTGDGPADARHARHEGCHGPGPVMGGRVWYRPLAGNASVTGTEAEGYLRHGLLTRKVCSWASSRPTASSGAWCRRGGACSCWRRRPGCRSCGTCLACPGRRATAITADSPTRRLTRREPDDGAPRVPGEAEDTLPGAFGPIALRDMVAYRVIEPAANDAAYKVEITIPTATTRRVRFVDPDGRPVRGAVSGDLLSSDARPTYVSSVIK